MSDLAVPTPLHIGTFGPYSGLAEASLYQSSGNPASITWVANLAIFVPIVLPFPYLVSRLWWMNGSTITTSNADMGIYTKDGTRLASAGSTAMVGTGTIQYAALGTPMLLAPGRYFFGWSCDNTTSRGFGLTSITANHGRAAGLLQQATALPLPASATFAALANALVPWCGVTRTASGF